MRGSLAVVGTIEGALSSHDRDIPPDEESASSEDDEETIDEPEGSIS